MMKFKNYIILLILLIVISPISVRALKVNDIVTNNGRKEKDSYLKVQVKMGDSDLTNAAYYGSSNGKEYLMFCMNPGAGLGELKVKNFLSQDSPTDSGMAHIATESNYDRLNLNSNMELLYAKQMALRVYWIKIGGSISGTVDSRHTALSTSKNCWDAGNSYCPGGLWATGDRGPAMLAAAQTLYTEATDIMNNFVPKNDNLSEPKVNITEIKRKEASDEFVAEHNLPESGVEISDDDLAGVSTLNEIAFYEINLTNFEIKDGRFAIAGLEKTMNGESGIIGMSFTNSTNEKDYTAELPLNTNLFELYASEVEKKDEVKNLKFYIAIYISGKVNFTEADVLSGKETVLCNQINLKYNATLNEKFFDVAILEPTPQCSNCQHMVSNAVAEDPYGNGKSYTYTISANCKIANDPCDPTVCEGPNCDASFPNVCRDDAPVNENGNVLYKFLEAFSKDTNKYSIKKCILKAKKDAANNSYRLVDTENAVNVADNPYCQVMCKEDYILEVPYKKNVNEGRFFSIDVSLTGQQDCYSTKLNIDKYHTDAKAKIKEVVEAYNTWAKYYELTNNPLVESTEELKCSDTTIMQKQIAFGSLPYYAYDEATGAVKETTAPAPQTFGKVDNSEGTCDEPLCIANNAKLSIDDLYAKDFGGLDLVIDNVSDNTITFTIKNYGTKEVKLSDIHSLRVVVNHKDDFYVAELAREKGITAIAKANKVTANGKTVTIPGELTLTVNTTEKPERFYIEDTAEYGSADSSNDDNRKTASLCDLAKDNLEKSIVNEARISLNEFDSNLDAYLEITDYNKNEVKFKISNNNKDNAIDLTKLDEVYLHILDKESKEIKKYSLADIASKSGVTEIGKASIVTVNSESILIPFEKEFTVSSDKEPSYFSVNTTSDCNGFCKITMPEEDYRGQLSGFVTERSKASTELSNKVKEFKKIIDEFNSCAGDKNYDALTNDFPEYWKMIYEFEPEIAYSYDEPVPYDRTIDKWINTVRNMSCNGGKCDTMYPIREEIFAESCNDDENCKVPEEPVKSPFTGQDIKLTEYCTGNITDEYICEGTSKTELTSEDYAMETYFMCDFDTTSKKFTCENRQYPVTKINYIHKTAVADGTYTTRRVYYTGTPSGDIKIADEGLTLNNYQAVPGLPVAANTPQGTYFYVISLSNIGRYFNPETNPNPDTHLGRILSKNENSIITYLDGKYENQKTIDYSHDTQSPSKEIGISEYACSYTVSQNSCYNEKTKEWFTEEKCEYGEGGKHKDWEDCKKDLCPNLGNYCVKAAESYYSCETQYFDASKCKKYNSRDEAIAASKVNYSCCPNCEVVCVGSCLYVLKNNKAGDGELQLDFRTITPANMNPNNRKLGYNWDKQNGSNDLVAQKAGNTISEIEARANVSVGSEVENVDDYSLQVTMTPNMVKTIKDYNDEQIDNGSYNNDSLECYDYTLEDYKDQMTCEKNGYTWDGKACVMAKVFCYSTFIDKLIEEYGDDVKAPHRDEAKNSAHKNYSTYQGINSLPNKGSEIISVNDYWTVYKYTNLDVNGDGMADIGPSWK